MQAKSCVGSDSSVMEKFWKSWVAFPKTLEKYYDSFTVFEIVLRMESTNYT